LLDGEGYFSVENNLTTSAAGAPSVVAVQSTREDKLALRLSGEVPLGITGVSYRRRVESPLHFAGYKMVEALRSMRVQLPASVKLAATPPGAALLASRASPPLSSVLYALGKNSDNFVAEMLLKVLAAEHTRKPGNSAAGVRVVLEALKRQGVTTGNLEMVNGSGLFAGNRVAASHVTRLLEAMYANTALRAEFLAQLSVGGVDGTLELRFQQLPAPRIVRAKTGTLADVIALSGYVLGTDRAIAFSVLANGVRGKHHAARSLADAIVNDIALHLYQSTGATSPRGAATP
jgi:D-alanyl-D-alanine carboxypeptidase/D-alanyl-D-alanine-endopeptidase (penicillin-binding protein 4)